MHVLTVRLTPVNLFALIIFFVLWNGIHELFGLHTDLRDLGQMALARKAVLACVVGSALFIFFPVTSHSLHSIWEPETMFFSTAVVGSVALRLWIRQALMNLKRRTSNGTRILMVGSGPIAERVSQSLRSCSATLEIVGFVDTPGAHDIAQSIKSALLGDLDRLESILMSIAVDEVVIALPLRSCYDKVQEVLKVCELVGVPAAYAYEPFRHDVGYSRIEQSPLTYWRWRPSRGVESNPVKRTVDILLSAVALTVLAPVFFVVITAIKMTSPGPVFFIQNRYGLNKRKFRMFKFRTMVPNAEALQSAIETRNEAQGPVFKIRQDPRITSIGFFLRRTSLDELPQLVNVLKGDMSLVGPRPLPIRDVEKFIDPWSMRRFSVKPGLTCLWQIHGRSNTNFNDWIVLDLKYIDTWSPLLDLQILAQTIPAVLRGSGAC